MVFIVFRYTLYTLYIQIFFYKNTIYIYILSVFVNSLTSFNLYGNRVSLAVSSVKLDVFTYVDLLSMFVHSALLIFFFSFSFSCWPWSTICNMRSNRGFLAMVEASIATYNPLELGHLNLLSEITTTYSQKSCQYIGQVVLISWVSPCVK